MFRDLNINGYDYMRNIVYLLVFFNSRGFSNVRKFFVILVINGDISCLEVIGKY